MHGVWTERNTASRPNPGDRREAPPIGNRRTKGPHGAQPILSRVTTVPCDAVLNTLWIHPALQPWVLWYLRRNPPKHVLLRQGFGGHPHAFLQGLTAVASCVGG